MKKIVAMSIIVFFCGVLPAEETANIAVESSVQSVENTQGITSAQSPDAWRQRVLTVTELQKYDGTDGKPAYIAVEGIVYDVTDVREWAQGQHMGRHYAGSDLTYEFNNEAPYAIHKGAGVLGRLPKVGVLTTNPNAVPGASAPVPGVQPKAAAPAKKSEFTDIKISASMYGKPAACPVTGVKFKISGSTPAIKHKGKTYYFCCSKCPSEFRSNPGKYINKQPAAKKPQGK